MLTHLQVKNFRSCHNVTLKNIGSVTALIGRNAVGKSNILKAIAALGQIATSTGPDSIGWEHAWHLIHSSIESDNPLSFDAIMHLPQGVYSYSLKIRWQEIERDFAFRIEEKLEHTSKRSGDSTLFDRNGETVTLKNGAKVTIGVSTAALPALNSLFPATDPNIQLLEPIQQFFSKIRYYPLDEPAESKAAPLIDESDYRKWLSEYTASGDIGTNVPIQILHLEQTQPDKFQHLKDCLSRKGLRVVPGIEITRFTAPKNRTFYFVQFSTKEETLTDPFAVNFFNLSQGTRRVVRLLTAICYGDSPLILLEHPEDGVHKGLVRKLAAFFRDGSTDGQVFLSTHSDTLMNELDPKSVRFVTIERGRTKVRALSKSELAAASEYISSDVDGTLSEFLHGMEE